MPKAVDIYVLEKKIGCGQFGDVFKGYSKVDGTEVAIKTINRSKIKGKFTELLDNQIKVLRSCKNNNIIRLIDIKKTANNIYLILQYCNEGDLGAYLKLKKKIPEDQAVQYFVQILHAFSTLVKNKIMHRDFKLPNVLKHEGVIKLADFGFAKLLGSEDQQVETILGSPLNMAPQVLDKQAYNSKADIWSIGVSFYEMIFGKVPFTAGNIIDLLKKIKKDPITFPQKVSPVIEDVLRKMLVVDPAKRIQWNQLFNHPITTYLEDKIGQSLRQSIICNKQDLKFNLSKFYLKTNPVIETPYQINARQQLNAHIKQMMKEQSPTKFTGHIIKRNMERKQKPSSGVLNPTTEKEIKQQMDEDTNNQIVCKQLTDHEICQENWRIILHSRNLYAFLGHIAEEALENNFNIYGQCFAFLCLKKAISQIAILKREIATKNVYGVKKWQIYQKTEQHKKIMGLVSQQQEIFNQLYEKLALKVLQKGTLAQFEQDLMISGKFTVQETQRQTLIRVIVEYFNRSIGKKEESTKMWKHFNKVIDSLDIGIIFPMGFDFGRYYQGFNQIEDELAIKSGRKKVGEFLKNYSKFKP